MGVLTNQEKSLIEAIMDLGADIQTMEAAMYMIPKERYTEVEIKVREMIKKNPGKEINKVNFLFWIMEILE